MHSTSPLRAVATVVALFVLCALLVRYASRPPAPVPASAPATEFSAERAMAHVREIAQRPHPIGSADHARVREYVLARLRALGLEPQVQAATAVGTRYPEAGYVRNVLARLPGRTPGGASVVLMAHYDGVAGGPAAGDDGAGTAAILETLRALRAGAPLAHDVIALITDGEEAGLLGAAAFVREHPWAKDVGVTLNVEARGTSGRSYMFETGPGNLDVARVLRRVRDVSATSLSVTIYRSLPNDTDLSEIALLGKPALNFAFADGAERYHTAHDDVAHLDPGSLQHHGSQMLTLARAFGDGPLPRPVTGDAVFFDLPFVGLIVYPESWALPISLGGALLVVVALFRLARARAPWVGGVVLGAIGTIVSTCVAAGLALLAGNSIVRMHDTMGWGGAPEFRGIYTVALAMLALAVSLAVWALVRRWATVASAHVGALVVWAGLTIVATLKLPGVSFVFAWPLIASAIASLAASRTPVGTTDRRTPNAIADVLIWVATALGLAVLVSIVYSISSVILGVAGPGGITAGVLVALVAWLLAPQLEVIGGRRWIAAISALVATAALVGTGMATVRSSSDHPTPSVVAYAVDADSTDAWLIARGGDARTLTASTTPGGSPPVWLTRLLGRGRSVTYVPVSRVGVAPPTTSLIADSTVGAERRIVVLIRPAPGTETINMQAIGARVLRAAIDGRAIDTSRYRRGVRSWRLAYSAPPAAGITLALAIPTGLQMSLDLMARSPGLPPLPGTAIPSRTPDVVTIQTGDVTLVHREVRIP
jgi:Peptidase family M28